MRAAPEDVPRIYERRAAAYDAARSRSLFEAGWLERLRAALPAGGRVLDLGCGTGEPVGRWLAERGFHVIGLDLSEAMLDIARRRRPDGDWRRGDMRDFELGGTVDGIVAWDSFFHLSPAEQRSCIGRMARHLGPGGSVLLTVGPRAGTAVGAVGGEPIYHASLSPAEYACCLEEHGLRLTGFLTEDPDADRHSVLMARKDEDTR